MRGISDALKQRLRRADPTARIMVEGRIETAADIKQRYDQWGDADSLTGLERLQSGGVRLTASTANGPLNATHNATARTLLDPGPPGAPYIDPLSPNGLTGGLTDILKYRLAALVHWAGTESNALELTQVQAWLNPQYDLTVDKHVARWRCDLYALTAIYATNGWTLRPLATTYADAGGQAAGFVNFDFTEERPAVKTSPTFNAQLDLGVPASATLFGPVTVAFFSGLKSDGSPSDNIGLGYDNAHSSAASAAGSYLYGFGFNWLFRGELSGPGAIFQSPGVVYSYGLSTNHLPSVKFIVPSHTTATITFSDGTPDVNLGVSTPKAQIELVGRGQTPSGTALTYQVQDDSAIWQTFTDGQTLDTVTGTFASANYTTLKMRSTLTTNAAGDATPILRGLGARAVSTTNLSDVAEVQSVSWAFDPLDHHAEIPELTLAAIHDGERDFRDAVSLFLSQQSIGQMLLRLYCGDASLGKSDWVHLDDFLIDDYDLAADRAYITGVSSLALVRGALPKLTDQGTAYPDGTISNPGVWTEIGGATNLYAALADNEGGIGLVPWDDTTAIQSVVNPSSAAYTASLQNISQPATPIVGQVIVQFRYKLVSGTSLTLAVALMQGATQKSSVTLTATSSNVTPGTLTPTVTELAAISDWTDLRLRFTANGTGQIQVTWARLVVLPVRQPLTYSIASPATISEDLLGGQIGLDGRYRGPNMKGIPGLDTGTTLTFGKTIAAPVGGSTDLTIAKQELDAVAFASGGVWISSQGRLVYRQLYDVTVATDGTATYAPKTRAPAVFISREELTPTSVRPGFQYRVPEFDVDWGFIESSGSYTGMAHGVSDVALQNLGEARIVPQKHAPEVVSRWIQDQNTANALSFRQVTAFGMGFMGWRFLSEYAYPELELGDVIAIETDRFLAYDPSAARQIAGAQWVACIVTGIFDPWGHDISVWVPSFASIGSANAQPPIIPKRRIDNLIFNGDFEQGTTGWSLAGTLESGADVIAGSASLLILGPQGAPDVAYQKDPTTGRPLYVPVIAGDTILLKATAKMAVNTIVGSLRASFYDAAHVSGSPISEVDVLVWSETTATTKTGTVTVPAGASFVNFSAVMDPPAAPPATYRGWFDDLSAFFSAPLQGNPGTANATGLASLVLNKQFGLTTSSTTEVSLTTYSLPADALAVDGQSVRIHLSGQFKHATGGEVRVKFGGTYALSYSNGAARNWDSLITITRTGATAQISTAGTLDDTPASAYERNAPAETLSGAVTIDFRGWTNNATQAMTIDMLTVEHLAAAS